jgi:Icc-related predicted phosphoesterase
MCDIDGVKFYGSPWCNWLGGMAFDVPDEDLSGHLSKIPNNIDVLITHIAPYKICDLGIDAQHFGSPQLLDEVFKKKPKLHIFGHIHSDGGKYVKLGNTLFVNVSTLSKGILIDYDEMEVIDEVDSSE